jgi:hypothetical protein
MRFLCKFGMRRKLSGFLVSIEKDSGYAASAACQISGIRAVRPPSFRI